MAQEEKARYVHDSSGLQITTPAVWDSGSELFYAAAQAVGNDSTSEPFHVLVCWPAARANGNATLTPNHNQDGMASDPPGTEDRASDGRFLMDTHVRRIPLPRAVHSLWPIGPPSGPRSLAGGSDPDAPSTSGRAASGPAAAVPRSSAAGVMIVHTDGSVALNTQYMNGKMRTVKPCEGRVAAASGSHGLLAVVTVDSQLRHRAAIYAAQVRPHTPPPKKERIALHLFQNISSELLRVMCVRLRLGASPLHVNALAHVPLWEFPGGSNPGPADKSTWVDETWCFVAEPTSGSGLDPLDTRMGPAFGLVRNHAHPCSPACPPPVGSRMRTCACEGCERQ